MSASFQSPLVPMFTLAFGATVSQSNGRWMGEMVIAWFALSLPSFSAPGLEPQAATKNEPVINASVFVHPVFV